MVGKIGWVDLTIDDAESVSEFYAQVVGWKKEPVSLGDYNDFNMLPADEADPITGICHARGGNADIPSQWMLYVEVADLTQSMENCTQLGGELIGKTKTWNNQRYQIIRDPAGAVMTLFDNIGEGSD